ncbi:nucleotidyltransferase family protein [Conexibacter sp. JD483]|uniref:nucleotidyltransferase family protein n=1 Tax=Conexibacter sp. JD483 TaxID=3064471 RepID=UPI0028708B69|nr:nucleotidyltransferase family protein [Conexibacter sp. JD483]MDR9368953.1 nucleotidyltransferase family protein [Conexibacter sp. JD483]
MDAAPVAPVAVAGTRRAMTAERVVALVLAAGAGRRFGGAKQLAQIDGRPLLERPLRALAGVAGIAETLVTLGARADEVRAQADLHGARPVLVRGWDEGIAASLRAGLTAAADADALLVVLGDQAWLRAEHVEHLLACARAAPPFPAVRAVHDGVPGHPVLLRRPLFPALAELRGDRGAGALLRGIGVVEVELGAAAVADVDRPADVAARGGPAPRPAPTPHAAPTPRAAPAPRPAPTPRAAEAAR